MQKKQTGAVHGSGLFLHGAAYSFSKSLNAWMLA